MSKILTPARIPYIHIVSSCRNVIPIVLPSLVANPFSDHAQLHCTYICIVHTYICIFRVPMYIIYIYLYARRIRENAFYASSRCSMYRKITMVYWYLYTNVSLLWWDVIVYNVYCKRIFAAGALNETRRRWSCRRAGVGTRELWPDRVRWSGEWFERSSLRDLLQLRYGSYIYIYFTPC